MVSKFAYHSHEAEALPDADEWEGVDGVAPVKLAAADPSRSRFEWGPHRRSPRKKCSAEKDNSQA